MSQSRPPIAVVGLSALFPGSNSVGGFWHDIVAGRDLITDVPESHWLVEDYYDPDPSAPDKTYARRGAFLSPVDFDPLEHGVPPTIVPATDTSQLLALIVAKQVLEDATSGRFANLDRDRVSVILGITSAQELLVEMGSRLQRPVWVKALREHGLPEDEVQRICDRIAGSYVPWQESTFPGLLGNVVAGRIANRLNLGGTNCVTDAACASALSALSMGLNELYLGDSDLVLCGGVETLNDIFMYMCFSKTPALSPSGDCRPFDASADGTMLGEGLGFLALRRLEDAERDGDRIYAVIRGLGSSSDGRAKSVYAPVPEGQAKALRRAYRAAGYGPETVELVEAHGTGTKAGDVAEFEGLRTVFEETGRADRQWCALGSVKSQIGHTKAAAGAAGLLKVVLALHHKVLPPTIKVERPHPGLALETSPFYLGTEARPWIRAADHPRRGSVSSFGFGGSNFHCTLEEYLGPAPRAGRFPHGDSHLVLLSAPSAAALAARAREPLAGSLGRVARRSQETFDSTLPARLAVVAHDTADLLSKLERAAAALDRQPEQAFSTPDGVHVALGPASPGRLAFLFPGQGSQYLRMGADLAMAFEPARKVWDAAAASLPLHDVVFPRTAFTEQDRAAQAARLTATEWAQPALGAASGALLAVLGELGIRPDAVAGHSFGEVTALHAAGALDADSFLRVARRRGELMAQAAGVPGAMLAVPAPREDVERLLHEWPGLVVANHNSPRQVVLSGSVADVEAARARLADEGIGARRLSVATAFHSPIVSPSATPFREFLDGVAVQAPALPVWGDADAAPYPSAPAAVRGVLAEQIARPVRFVELIEGLYASGVRTFVEVGPGSVLSGLVSEILAGREHAAIPLDRKGAAGLGAFWQGLGRLAVRGIGLALDRLHADLRPEPEPPSKPALTLAISGANYGRPYPPPGGAAALPQPNPPRPAGAEPRPVRASEPTAPAAPPPSQEWLATYQEMQRQTSEAHAAWQQTMTETHLAFLRSSEAAFAALGGLGPAQSIPTAPVAVAPIAVAAAPAPPAQPVPTARPTPAAGPVSTTAAAPAAPAVLEVRSGSGALLEVVAEKTGYPVEMLRLEMSLEADLGIDSIKRVEILAALQDRLPGAPAVSASEMATLRTLGQIADRLGASGQAAPVGAVVPGGAAGAAAPTQDARASLLEVVAEKTGYPVEMLRLEMSLEADLGIDSIKRVEILAALQDRLPGAPAVSASEMAGLRTLGQIAERLGDGGALAPATLAPAPPDVRDTLLAVVAEKTGYPPEMLHLEMSLEADLGIDSIKRVEILAALQDRLPGTGTVSAAEMASLRTLGQIAERLTAGAPRAAAIPVEPAPQASELPRFALREIEAPRRGLAPGGLFSGRPVAITSDGNGVAHTLAGMLVEKGLPAQVVDEVPAEAGAVIFLGGLREARDEAQAVEVNREAFRAARAVAARFSAEGGVFVTVQDTGGDFGLSGGRPLRAWLAGLPGLVKTAAREWPRAALRAIDVERGGRPCEAVASALVEELLDGAGPLEVGLRSDGRRTTLTTVREPSAPGPLPIGPADVVVATGGARGVTLACLLELARRARPRLVLIGRTPLDEPAGLVDARDEATLQRALLETARREGRSPSPAELRAEARRVLAVREVQAGLAALRAAGAETLYFCADARQPAELGRALQAARDAFGPITALVHGAGVLADRKLTDKTPEQFDLVFDTKVVALRALLAETREDPLRVLAVFSSVAGRCGNAGQADYAMANEVLARVAAAEAGLRPGLVVKALDWGPWDGGMVDAGLRSHFRSQGVELIDLEAGARAFVDELGRPGVELVLGADPELGLTAGRATEASFEIAVSAESHPWLRSHAVQGVPVVPAVLALEWCLRAARLLRPDLEPAAARDLRVLKGIRLETFEAPTVLRLTAREVTNGSGAVVAVELRGAGGVLHYGATVELRQAGLRRPASATLDLPGASLAGPHYGERLFHGPDLQLLSQVARTDAGLVAQGVVSPGLAGGPWTTDVAALDAALQLAILWGLETVGRPTLPTGIGQVTLHRAGRLEGPLQLQLRGSSASEHRVLSGVQVLSAEGELLAELADVEMTVAPGLSVPALETARPA